MAQFRNRLGQYSRAGGKLILEKKGDWDAVTIALNNLADLPDEINKALPDIAATIIAPCLESTKRAGNFAPNTELTASLKGYLPPWNSPEGATGEPAIFTDGGGVEVMLSGDQDKIMYVNEGAYNHWSDSYTEGRDLFGQTWQNCEDEVKRRIDQIVATYTTFAG